MIFMTQRYKIFMPVTQNGHLTGMLSLADLARRGNFSMETAQCMESICSPVVHLD